MLRVELERAALEVMRRHKMREMGASVGAWEFDVSTGLLLTTPDYYSVLGLPVGPLAGPLGLLASRCLIPSADALHDATNRLQTGRSFSVPLTMRLDGGGERKIRLAGSRTHRTGRMAGTLVRVA